MSAKSEKRGLIKPRRALLSVSDKTGLGALGKALADLGTELVATGKTAQVLRDAGLRVRTVEEISGSAEAFQGRMKTLSFPICSGILYRRGDEADERDLKALGFLPIDVVVVNFYPFEKAAAKPGIGRDELIEQIDIGGPTLVRAAAKNSESVLVLTDPAQYEDLIKELDRDHGVSLVTREALALGAWRKVHQYDEAIVGRLGQEDRVLTTVSASGELRYGENPHQKARIEAQPRSPIAWLDPLTDGELSYNNILDVSAAYGLASDLLRLTTASTGSGAVIVKHNNPCGAAWVPSGSAVALELSQKLALIRAWEGDPVSAFGGVVVLTEALQVETAEWLGDHFIELIAAPDLRRDDPALRALMTKRKNLKAVRIERFGEEPKRSSVQVPGAVLHQDTDLGVGDEFRNVTQRKFDPAKEGLARFGIAVARALKSNAIALVREIPGVEGSYQLIGAGQGQPNRIDALKGLAIPRAQAVLSQSGGSISDAVLVSDAFFPFRDSVDAAYSGGVRWIVQPGGSRKDAESIEACDEHKMGMAFTGMRHFRH